jgi:hypothetical protein
MVVSFDRGSGIVGVLASLTLGPALFAQARTCDSLRPLEGSPYGYRDRGNRCEGLYIADYGSRSIELVSLTRGMLRFGLSSQLNLRVWAPADSQPLHVRAVAKPARTPYRMDSILRPGTTLLWPVGDVLFPQGITAARLGVFAWKGNDSERLYVPVRVTPEEQAPDASSRSPVVLSIRPSFDATAVKWRSAAFTGGECAPFNTWNDATTAPVDADVAVDISLSALNGSSCVEVAAESVDGKWATADLKIDLSNR